MYTASSEREVQINWGRHWKCLLMPVSSRK